MKIMKRIKQNGLSIDISNGRNLVVILPKTVENATLVATCATDIRYGLLTDTYPYIGSKDRHVAIGCFLKKLLDTGIKEKLIVAPCLSNLEVAVVEKLRKQNIILTSVPLDWDINPIMRHMFECADNRIAEVINKDKIDWIRSNQEYEELMQHLHDDEMLQL